MRTCGRDMVSGCALVSAQRPIFGHFIDEVFAEFQQKELFEPAVAIDLSFHHFVLCQSLFHAVLCVQLRVSSLIDVTAQAQQTIVVTIGAGSRPSAKTLTRHTLRVEF